MPQGDLTGRKVLVVEDDYFQALTLKEALTEHGAEVIGPFSAPETGLLYCGRGLVDAAILDVKVSGGHSFLVADKLTQNRIPFIFVTGYERNVIPHRFWRVPHYLKPFVGQDAPAALALAMALARVTKRGRTPKAH